MDERAQTEKMTATFLRIPGQVDKFRSLFRTHGAAPISQNAV